MNKKNRLESKWNSLLYNHLWLKYIVEYGFTLIMTVLSALIFAFGLRVFIKPVVEGITPIASGGVSGFSQVIELAIKLFATDVPQFFNYIFEYMYVIINIPLIIFAFKKIGKRFAIFTLINVVSVSLFSIMLDNFDFIKNLAEEVNSGGMVARALFAGLCTGISSAIAFKIETSAGGFDIVSYHISLRKGTNTGPYLVVINGSILIIFTILSGLNVNGVGWPKAIAGIFYSIVYLFTTTLLIDLINIRNKKTLIEIVTSDEKLPDKLMAYIPHGATILKGKGVYSGAEKFLIHMVVSTTEVKKVVKIIKQLDESSFVNVISLQKVYGNFHMKTIK